MAAESKVSLKLVIDKKGKRVVYAEAGKDFVDFLFQIFTLPLGTVIRLLRKHENIGSLPNLYGSIENLNDCYIQPNQTKDVVLKPVLLSPVSGNGVPLLGLTDVSSPRKSYKCGKCYNHYVSDPTANCPGCQLKMTYNYYVAPPCSTMPEEGGFVKGVVTYMVTDDLVVTPRSIITSIALIQQSHAKGLTDLEEKVVNFGIDEALKLVNASMQTEKVLTHVFLDRASVNVKTECKTE